MIIIFDTNPLNPQNLIRTKLPKGLESFFKSCREAGHKVIIPQTTLFEFTRHQNKARLEEVKAIEKAYKTLDHYNVEHSHDPPEKFVPTSSNLLELILDLGVKCTLVEPLEEELREAHKRACFRENPHPPEKESDEMRDLVIWMLALRIAKENGGAVLLSNDEVHTHHRGDKEAVSHNLTRLKTLEDALEHFKLETPSGSIIKRLLKTAWYKIHTSDLPITCDAQIISVRKMRFTENVDGKATVYFELVLSSGDGKNVTADVEINYFDTRIYSLIFNNIIVDDKPLVKKPIKVDFEAQIADITSDLDDRLENLKELLGD